jgi:hypothetical protein
MHGCIYFEDKKTKTDLGLIEISQILEWIHKYEKLSKKQWKRFSNNMVRLTLKNIEVMNYITKSCSKIYKIEISSKDPNSLISCNFSNDWNLNKEFILKNPFVIHIYHIESPLKQKHFEKLKNKILKKNKMNNEVHIIGDPGEKITREEFEEGSSSNDDDNLEGSTKKNRSNLTKSSFSEENNDDIEDNNDDEFKEAEDEALEDDDDDDSDDDDEEEEEDDDDEEEEEENEDNNNEKVEEGEDEDENSDENEEILSGNDNNWHEVEENKILLNNDNNSSSNSNNSSTTSSTSLFEMNDYDNNNKQDILVKSNKDKHDDKKKTNDDDDDDELMFDNDEDKSNVDSVSKLNYLPNSDDEDDEDYENEDEEYDDEDEDEDEEEEEDEEDDDDEEEKKKKDQESRMEDSEINIFVIKPIRKLIQSIENFIEKEEEKEEEIKEEKKKEEIKKENNRIDIEIEEKTRKKKRLILTLQVLTEEQDIIDTNKEIKEFEEEINSLIIKKTKNDEKLKKISKDLDKKKNKKLTLLDYLKKIEISEKITEDIRKYNYDNEFTNYLNDILKDNDIKKDRNLIQLYQYQDVFLKLFHELFPDESIEIQTVFRFLWEIFAIQGREELRSKLNKIIKFNTIFAKMILFLKDSNNDQIILKKTFDDIMKLLKDYKFGANNSNSNNYDEIIHSKRSKIVSIEIIINSLNDLLKKIMTQYLNKYLIIKYTKESKFNKNNQKSNLNIDLYYKFELHSEPSHSNHHIKFSDVDEQLYQLIENECDDLIKKLTFLSLISRLFLISDLDDFNSNLKENHRKYNNILNDCEKYLDFMTKKIDLIFKQSNLSEINKQYFTWLLISNPISYNGFLSDENHNKKGYPLIEGLKRIIYSRIPRIQTSIANGDKTESTSMKDNKNEEDNSKDKYDPKKDNLSNYFDKSDILVDNIINDIPSLEYVLKKDKNGFFELIKDDNKKIYLNIKEEAYLDDEKILLPFKISVFKKIAKETQSLDSNNKTENKIFKTKGDDSNVENQWYSIDNLINLLENYCTLDCRNDIIPLIFNSDPRISSEESFRHQLTNVLYISRQTNKKNFCFICIEPGAGNNHFIFIIYYSKKLYIINPTGKTKHKDFKKIIEDECKNRGISFYESEKEIQKDSDSLVNCGPICIEMMHNLLLIKKETIDAEIKKKDDKEFLNFIVTSITKNIDGDYKNNLEKIREKHNPLKSESSSNSEYAQIQNKFTNFYFDKKSGENSKPLNEFTREIEETKITLKTVETINNGMNNIGKNDTVDQKNFEYVLDDTIKYEQLLALTCITNDNKKELSAIICYNLNNSEEYGNNERIKGDPIWILKCKFNLKTFDDFPIWFFISKKDNKYKILFAIHETKNNIHDLFGSLYNGLTYTDKTYTDKPRFIDLPDNYKENLKEKLLRYINDINSKLIGKIYTLELSKDNSNYLSTEIPYKKELEYNDKNKNKRNEIVKLLEEINKSDSMKYVYSYITKLIPLEALIRDESNLNEFSKIEENIRKFCELWMLWNQLPDNKNLDKYLNDNFFTYNPKDTIPKNKNLNTILLYADAEIFRKYILNIYNTTEVKALKEDLENRKVKSDDIERIITEITRNTPEIFRGIEEMEIEKVKKLIPNKTPIIDFYDIIQISKNENIIRYNKKTDKLTELIEKQPIKKYLQIILTSILRSVNENIFKQEKDSEKESKQEKAFKQVKDLYYKILLLILKVYLKYNINQDILTDDILKLRKPFLMEDTLMKYQLALTYINWLKNTEINDIWLYYFELDNINICLEFLTNLWIMSYEKKVINYKNNRINKKNVGTSNSHNNNNNNNNNNNLGTSINHNNNNNVKNNNSGTNINNNNSDNDYISKEILHFIRNYSANKNNVKNNIIPFLINEKIFSQSINILYDVSEVSKIKDFCFISKNPWSEHKYWIIGFYLHQNKTLYIIDLIGKRNDARKYTNDLEHYKNVYDTYKNKNNNEILLPDDDKKNTGVVCIEIIRKLLGLSMEELNSFNIEKSLKNIIPYEFGLNNKEKHEKIIKLKEEQSKYRIDNPTNQNSDYIVIQTDFDKYFKTLGGASKLAPQFNSIKLPFVLNNKIQPMEISEVKDETKQTKTKSSDNKNTLKSNKFNYKDIAKNHAK